MIIIIVSISISNSSSSIVVVVSISSSIVRISSIYSIYLLALFPVAMIVCGNMTVNELQKFRKVVT